MKDTYYQNFTLFLLSIALLLGISFTLSLFIVYLIHSLIPKQETFVKDFVRIKGVKWIIFLTIISAAIAFTISTITHGINPCLISFYLPIIFISCLNLLGIEFLPNFLKEEQHDKATLYCRRTILDQLLNSSAPEINGLISKEFKWKHKNENLSLTLTIRREIYEKFKHKGRTDNFRSWATEYVAGGICGEISELAYKLLTISKDFGIEEVKFVLSFIQQSIKYDRRENEPPKYPIETLVEETGDLKDLLILGASILKAMGYEVAIVRSTDHTLGISLLEINDDHIEDSRYHCFKITPKGWEEDKVLNNKVEIYTVPDNMDMQA